MPEDQTAKSALIIGASRGIGLGLAKEFLGRGWDVTATVRAAADTGLEKFHEHVTMESVDINDNAAVDAFAARMKSRVFDVVCINAGIGGPTGKTAETVEAADVTHVYMTNAISPVRLAYKLRGTVKPETGVIAFMSSTLGSIELNTHGQMQIYSSSKAALNQLTRAFAADTAADKTTILSLHPGWVRTDMGGDNADIDVETSVKGLADVLTEKAGAGGHEFVDYTGKNLPW